MERVGRQQGRRVGIRGIGPIETYPMARRSCLRIRKQLTSGPHIRMSINIEYFRINVDRWIDGSESSIKLLVAMQDEAAIEVGGGKGRIELDGLIEIGNRPIMLALLVPD